MIKYIVEFIGTFIFLSVILNVVGKQNMQGVAAIAIGLALAVAIFFGGDISGGHFNPAVSTMMAVKGSLSSQEYPGYVVAQLLGGLAAWHFYKNNQVA
jgi:aquaporin Z